MKKLIHYGIVAFGWLAVLVPLAIRFHNVTYWALDKTLPLTLFPFFGLTAFSLLWLHAMSGVFEPWLKNYINFDRFVHITATIILICIIMHPLLLEWGMDFSIRNLFSSYDSFYLWLAITGWCLLITYDIGKALKRHEFFTKHWNAILFISTLGFLLTFFHSLALGSDLQTGPLRAIWIFYGTTAILATIYTFGIKPWITADF